MCEIWKSILGYENYYEVSNLGNVRSKYRQYVDSLGKNRIVKSKLLTKQLMITGYYKVDLKVNYINKIMTIHRLVAIAFIPNPDNKPTVNHIDGNKINNHITNLEWATFSENNKHALDNGLRKSPCKLGKLNHNSKPVYQYSKTNIFICEYSNAREANKITGIDYRHISSCCLNKRKTTGGYIWKYQKI